jgi:hypothetical protein
MSESHIWYDDFETVVFFSEVPVGFRSEVESGLHFAAIPEAIRCLEAGPPRVFKGGADPSHCPLIPTADFLACCH